MFLIRHDSLTQMNAENKLEDGNYMSQNANDIGNVSNTSPTPIVNRIPEDTSQHVRLKAVKFEFDIDCACIV